MKNSNRFASIDFLRFLFAILIAFHHYLNTSSIRYSSNNYISSLYDRTFNLPYIVDFFFILAGYFLIRNWKNINFTSFVINKYIKLVPYMLIYLLLIKFLATLNITTYSFKESIFSILLLDNIGFTKENSGVAWFLSSYFFIIIFYYYLYKNIDQKYVYLLIISLVYFSYTFLINKQQGSLLGTNTVYNDFFNVGILRAVAGIGLGSLIGSIHFHSYNLKNMKLLYSIIEIALLYLLLRFLLWKNYNLNGLIYIVTFCFLLIFFIFRKGIISIVLDNNYSIILGRYSLAIYMMHEPILRFIRPIFLEQYPAFIDNHFILVSCCYLFWVIFFSICIQKYVVFYFNNVVKFTLLILGFSKS